MATPFFRLSLIAMTSILVFSPLHGSYNNFDGYSWDPKSYSVFFNNYQSPVRLEKEKKNVSPKRQIIKRSETPNTQKTKRKLEKINLKKFGAYKNIEKFYPSNYHTQVKKLKSNFPTHSTFFIVGKNAVHNIKKASLFCKGSIKRDKLQYVVLNTNNTSGLAVLSKLKG